MPAVPKNQARQVSKLGETPAEARRRMQESGGGEAASAEAPVRPADTTPASPQHIKAMREQEGFGGGPPEDATVEEAGDKIEAPTPTKAAETIRQLSQEKNQVQTELDAALNLISRYKAAYGELD